jgi:hypothetical protein
MRCPETITVAAVGAAFEDRMPDIAAGQPDALEIGRLEGQ